MQSTSAPFPNQGLTGGSHFPLVRELPYYTTPGLEQRAPAGCSRRGALRAGIRREEEIHAECAADFRAIAARLPDHRLTRSVADYLEKCPSHLAAEDANAAAASYAREATRAEALDATVSKGFYHLVYQRELFRLAEMVGDHPRAEAVRDRLARRFAEIERESGLCVLPLRPLVAVQACAGLLALDALARGALAAG